MKCFVCGSPIVQVGKGAHYAIIGRPKTYCSDYCRDYLKYFNAFQKSLSKIVLDDEHKRKIRGELFRVSNTLKLSPLRSFGTETPQGKK